ncbi:double-stranded RNA-specific editase Adar-like [Condylostylus longicornis]|uniref:double-stranded RNA-specific editase Adar-like n=1 Tax=Condylostylus longicornis TaxID=2530218 RepID=UPI00244DDBCB|nr:double-stranded RNA-specific editase Adar-like [Condylostylus longicornis]
MLQLRQRENNSSEMKFNSINESSRFLKNSFRNDFLENSNSSNFETEWNSEKMFGPYPKRRKLNENVMSLDQNFNYKDNIVVPGLFNYQRNDLNYLEQSVSQKNTVQKLRLSDMEESSNAYENMMSFSNTPNHNYMEGFGAFLNERYCEKELMRNNVIAELDSLRSCLNYKIEYESDSSSFIPFFMVSVEVDGRKYIGVGRSKEIAKAEAAKMALKYFPHKFDNFLKSELLKTNFPYCAENNIRNVSFKKLEEKKNNTVEYDEDPVSFLTGLVNDIHFRCRKIIDTRNISLFKMIVEVNDHRFEGTGRSKKLAKVAAAKAALAFLGIYCSPVKLCRRMKGVGYLELPQRSADVIGNLVLRQFETIIKGKNLRYRRKVLSGVVMTKNMNFDEAKVVCVSTGTKCLSGENINASGNVLNDCHAEIISRRCLLSFFYFELEKHLNPLTVKQSIFENNEGNANFPFKLRDGIQFHLYISTAPCGDAVILNPHSDVIKRGQLRYKVEATQGTIAVTKSDTIQTWDGVLKGELLRTMSCSDKIARWNTLGFQGALLANFIGPIYLNSIVLGSLLFPESMFRAVCGRIQKSIQRLPSPYTLNTPLLGMVTSVESRNLAPPPNSCINWTICDNKIEIVNPRTGKTKDNQVSRLAKISFFRRYSNIIKKLTNIFHKPDFDYSKTKNSAKDYQFVKNKLFKAFENENLGVWLKKPKEQDEFHFSD